MKRRPTQTVQLKLRFSEALRRRIEQAARRHELSINAEIVERLERSFARDDTAKVIGHIAELRKAILEFMAMERSE